MGTQLQGVALLVCVAVVVTIHLSCFTNASHLLTSCLITFASFRCLFEQQQDDRPATGNDSRPQNSWSSADREQQIQLHSAHRKRAKLLQKIAPQDGRRKVFAHSIDVMDPSYTPPYHPKTSDEFNFLDESLGENFVFSDLTAMERKMFIDAMQREDVKQGTRVIQQGDLGDFFYVLQEGTIQFLVKDLSGTAIDDEEDATAGEEKKQSTGDLEIEVGTCTSGGSFGELALLYNALRAATCVAVTDCTLWKIDRKTFQILLARRARDHEKDIIELMEKIPLLQGLSARNKSKFSSALTSVKFRQGDRIVTKGDVGEVFYIIQEGEVRVHDMGTGAQFVDQILGPGDYFGERALLTGDPREANVTAVTDMVTTFAMDRATFEAAIGPLQHVVDREMKKRILQGIPVIANSNFYPYELDQLVDLLQEHSFRKGTKLATAGNRYTQHLWIIQQGIVRVYSKNGDIFTLEVGDYFGDKNLGDSTTYISSYTAVCEENTTCWVLTRKDLVSVIRDINRLGEFLPYVSSQRDNKIRLHHLRKHEILGVGGFGKVWLASHRQKTKKVYALKMLDKRQLIEANQVKAILREKDIMSSLEHPFIISLVSSFQDESSLYLLLELIQGGELYSVIHAGDDKGLPEKDAQFYCACVLEGLGHMHQRSICYRDLKPENVLIDKKGYCVIVDLGFAKIVMDQTYTLCGTPEYLAPEVIMSKGHDKAVDYWSFGVLVYEALVGETPFYIQGSDQMSLFRRIIMVKYDFPARQTVSDEGKDLIEKLLVRRPVIRFGNRARGHLDVRDHPWFQKINFKKLLKKEVKAPWVPKITAPLDSSHFDDYKSAERKQRPGKPLTREEQELFRNF